MRVGGSSDRPEPPLDPPLKRHMFEFVDIKIITI